MKKNVFLILMIVSIIGCGGQNKAVQETPAIEGSIQAAASGNQHIQSGVEYLNKGDVAQAISSFDQAIRNDPSNPENYLVLGQVYMRLQKYARAVDTFMAAARISPDSGEVFYLLALANVFKEQQRKTSGDLVDAQNSHRDAIRSAQKSIDIFMKSQNEESFKKSVALLKQLTAESTPN